MQNFSYLFGGIADLYSYFLSREISPLKLAFRFLSADPLAFKFHHSHFVNTMWNCIKIVAFISLFSVKLFSSCSFSVNGAPLYFYWK